MALVTQPLRDEHKELFPHLEELRKAAEAVGEGEAAVEKINAAYRFLDGHLLPHAAAEEAALYPVVAKVMGSADATKTMEADHAAVGRLTDELRRLREALSSGGPTPEQARDLRRVLYGLYTLVSVHFHKEEDVYLPLLDTRLPPEEAAGMFEAMEAAAARAKRA